MRLHVGLNLLFLGSEPAGVGRVALELVGELGRRDDVSLEIFAMPSVPAELRACAEQASARVTRVPLGGRVGRVRAAAEYGVLPALALARRVDVLHSLGNAGPVRVPGMACVVSLHDVIWRRVGDEWDTAAARRAMDRVVGPTVRHADVVLTASEDAARDIVDEFGVARDHVAVAPNGVRVDPDAPFVDAASLRSRYGLGSGPVLLCVGQKRPYKNQQAVVRALATPEARRAILVLPGAPTPFEDRLRTLAAELGVTDRVRFLGHVTDDELEGLYRLATGMVLVSRYEGFGLPVLEAMARGVPVVCSDTTSLAEVAGDAALRVHPDDQPGIDAAVARLLADPALRERLVAAGHQRAAQFTWERTAAATVRAYRRAVAVRGRGGR